MVAPKKKSLRIMIVDRSKVARTIISRILKREINNVVIIVCGSAEEAIEYLQQEKFDLITTARLLPDLDGFELCRTIRNNEIHRMTPVLIVSSDANIQIQQKGFETGVTDYFNKALGHDGLVKFIKETLQRHSGIVGKVLYVDKGIDLLSIMEMYGLHIISVNSGEQALERLKNTTEYEFDMIVIHDKLEKEMTGGALVQKIRYDLQYSYQEMPVLLIEQKESDSTDTDMYYQGANDFIRQPVIEKVFLSRLKTLLLIKHQYKQLKRYARKINKLKNTDRLTGLYNKTFLFEKGQKFMSQHKEICLMMIDIDHFETLNETEGHVVGDHILRVFGHFLRHFLPQKIMMVRFDFKKITLLIPKCNVTKGKIIAEKVRLQVIKLKPNGLNITVSIGLSFSNGHNKILLDTLVSDADSALKSAYQQGHNCTCLCVTQKNIVAAA